MNDFEKWENEFNQPNPAEDELPEWVDSILDEHFIPPDPGQTPKLKTQTRKGVFTLISGVVVLIVSPFFNFGIGGLFAGALLGKHRIAPNISPKKSFEGLIGSFIFSIGIAGWLYNVWMDHPFWQGAILGFVATITATGGDLIESALKRDLGVKDMGHLLPGHGGFLDRLDSLVLTAPFAYFIITYFVSP